jgi:hypothetical protein
MSAVWPDKSALPDPNDPERAAYRAVRCLPGEIAPNVLVPGDPARAARIASEWLTDGKLVMVQREFHTYTGTYQGVPVSVISTGVGSPSAAMVMQDLGKLGCDIVIRVGTAGSCVKQVQPGNLGVAHFLEQGQQPDPATSALAAGQKHREVPLGASLHTDQGALGFGKAGGRESQGAGGQSGVVQSVHGDQGRNIV